MTIASAPAPSSGPISTTVTRWTLDGDRCHLLVDFPPGSLRRLAATGVRGWVELRERELLGSRISLRISSTTPGEEKGRYPEECVFQGSAVRLGAEGEMVVEGRLRVGDCLDSLTLAVIPTRYHRFGDTEYLDLDIGGPLPPSSSVASRVAGRLRLLRARPAA